RKTVEGSTVKLLVAAAVCVACWTFASPGVFGVVNAAGYFSRSIGDSLAQEDKKEEKKTEPFKIQRLTQGLGLYAIGPVSPDGKSILLLAQKPQQTPNLYVMDIASHSIRPPLTALKWGVTTPTWSPDGTLVAMGGANEVAAFPDIYVLDVAGGKLRQLTKNGF